MKLSDIYFVMDEYNEFRYHYVLKYIKEKEIIKVITNDKGILSVVVEAIKYLPCTLLFEIEVVYDENCYISRGNGDKTF